MSGFADEVIGGATTLIRQAIKSPNYVPGVSGWSINKDGSAEFNNVTIRGTVTDVEELIYSGAPALGNLIASIIANATTDDQGNAVIAGITSYIAPGLGLAVGMNGGEITFYSGPHSGAGPWTAILAMTCVGANQFQINSLQGPPGAAISVNTFGGGITLDGFCVGGDRVWVPGGNETYSSTTLQNSASLSISGLATNNLDYSFKLVVVYGGPNGAGITWNVVTDVGVGHAIIICTGTTGAIFTVADAFPLAGHSAETTGVGNLFGILIEGIIYINGGIGTVAMQFAQNVANATPVTIYRGSFMEIQRMA